MAWSGAELSGRNSAASNYAGIVVVDVVVTDDATSTAATIDITHDVAAIIVLRVEQVLVLVGSRFHCRQRDGTRMGWCTLLVDGMLGHGSQRDRLGDRTRGPSAGGRAID